MNKETKHYILGLLTGLLFIPIIEEFINVIMSWIQVLLLKPTKIVLEGNKEINELQDSEDYQQTNCIGFQMQNSADEYFEDDEY